MKAPDVITYGVPGWGVGSLAVHGARPVGHELPTAARAPGSRHVEAAAADAASHDPAERLVASFAAFFRGERVAWDADEIGLAETCGEWGLTPFGRQAALALAAVAYGERVSYGDLAVLAGAPRAARAAGTFCAHNRLSLLVPCHRVVLGDGRIGGYGACGPAVKHRLLALEAAGVARSPGREPVAA